MNIIISNDHAGTELKNTIKIDLKLLIVRIRMTSLIFMCLGLTNFTSAKAIV